MSSGVPPPLRETAGTARSWLAATLANGVTNPPAPRPGWLRRGRVDLVFVADVVIALICLGLTNSALGAQNASQGHHVSGNLLLLVAAVVCAPLVLRTYLPLTAWSAAAAATIWASLALPPRSLSSAVYLPAGILVYMLCLYAVAVRCRPWVVAGAGIVTVLGAVLIDPRTSAGAILAAIPVLAGVIVRSRRSSREELAVVRRRHEGERALLEERQRIARELHDVVAHHMSVIAIQAEAAPYKSADPPPELVESFGEIRASALTGLNELRRLLGVLRSDAPDTAPQPGLADLPGLLESAGNGGVTVSTDITGTPRPLPPGVDLSAYRITQEALSNAMRHAPGSSVRLRLAYGESGLMIEVRNDNCPAGADAAGAVPAAGGSGAANGAGAGGAYPGGAYPGDAYQGGHGIIGMRERAAMLGGHLSAAPTGNGEFLVTAFLPVTDGPAAGAERAAGTDGTDGTDGAAGGATGGITGTTTAEGRS
ncbi:MAG: sensor histidine kinase [Actinobacteria bacterium]|nr:sensor histidine kinase [Actinomycetota bacterium]